VLGQYSSGGGSGGGIGAALVIFYLAALVLYIAGLWKTFAKAGQPGWAAIVPFYNLWILVKIAGKPGWWFLLFFIPLVGVLLISIAVAENFGKSTGFGVGLTFLGFIFYPMLGFGDAQYRGPVAGIPPAPPMPA
jgi:uncharacterized membrane protein YhaH (DUF805 family)